MPLDYRCIGWWILVAYIVAVIVYFGANKNTRNNLDNLFFKCSENQGTNKEETNVLCMWLQDSKLLDLVGRLPELGVKNLEDVYKLEDLKIQTLLSPDDAKRWLLARSTLPDDIQKLPELKEKVLIGSAHQAAWKWVKEVAVVLLILWGVSRLAISCGWTRAFCPVSLNCTFFHGIIDFFIDADIRQTFLQWLSGNRALAKSARIVFYWDEPLMVGSTVSFTVEFFQRWSRRPYPVSDADSIRINIRQGANKIAAAVQIGGSLETDANLVKATFTVRRAGQYHIDVNLGSIPIRGSPFVKYVRPGPPDPSKTTLVRPTSMVVCTARSPHQVLLEPRDEYGNYCSWNHDAPEQQKALDAFSCEAYSITSSDVVRPLIQWLWVELMHRLIINVTFNEEGIYGVRLKLDDSVISKGEFNMIALSTSDTIQVEKALGARTATYETKLLSINGEKWTKNKKVFCAISPKQIALKEYILGIIPKRLATFRLCPATKVTFLKSTNKQEFPVLTIEDGAQFVVELSSKEAHLMAASFAHYLLKNIGGSETFTDKQGFFYQEIRKFHQKKPHEKLLLRVERDKILESSMKLTKSFSITDWCRNFEISFIGEQGLDWGGLRREWIELLCVAIFDRRQSGMFASFSDDGQALVHPNPTIPASCKLKHYEFAGKLVGKCLYESSLGATYRQLIKARFTRSFLAQLIGLRINYKYFEHDDPPLFLSKIKYIEENDVSDMELVFAEEEYDEQGKLLRTVELIPGGARIPVDNANKHRYLDALAQHRLVNSVRDQVDAFTRGLAELVPDNLLSIFDENELELLVCGTSDYSVAEMKAHHAAIGSSPEFQKVLCWFWTAVTNFGTEEMSRLLQFTTGSSQLPPGGLAELSPKLQIAASPCFGTLPTAHTCFNQLCLPDYENYEQFEKALLIAINEGSEGFGLV